MQAPQGPQLQVCVEEARGLRGAVAPYVSLSLHARLPTRV